MDEEQADSGRKLGVIVQTGQGIGFVSAEQTLGFVESARTSPVPGTTFSVLWFEGRVLLAVPFEACLAGAAARAQTPERPAPLANRRAALICELGGEPYALTGVDVLASGRFERVGSHEGQREATPGVRYAGGDVSLWVLSLPAAALAAGPPAAALAAASSGESTQPADRDRMTSGHSRLGAPGASEEAEGS